MMAIYLPKHAAGHVDKQLPVEWENCTCGYAVNLTGMNRRKITQYSCEL